MADINNLEYLSYVGGQLPGAYYVDVFLNKKKVDNKKIIFKADYINKKLRPEVTKSMLINWGVKNFASIEFSKKDMNENIDNFDSIMLGSNYHYDFLLNRLDISIPQIGLKSVSRGHIDDKELNDG
ncbi:MAG: FimD/PapC N-terminal domain-containing protein, partial [Providencia sp.]